MRRLTVVLVLVVALGAAGCSSSASEGGPSTTARTGSTSLAGAKTAAEQQAAAEKNRNTAIGVRCVTDLRTIQTAVEAAIAVNDEPPASLAALVPDLLTEAPAGWQLGPVGADGRPTVIPDEVGLAAGCRAEGATGG